MSDMDNLTYGEVLEYLGIDPHDDQPTVNERCPLLLDPPAGWLAWASQEHPRRSWQIDAQDVYRKASIHPRLRRAVFERDAYRCQQCGDWHNLTVDHIIPESKGGPTTLDNLQTLCRTCNARKGAKME